MTSSEDSGGHVFADILTAVCFGLAAAFIVSIAALAAFAAVRASNDVPATAEMPFGCISMGLGALVGGFVTGRAAKKRGLALGAVCGILFFAVLTLAGLFMHQTDLGVYFAAKALITVISGAAGGAAGINTSRKRQ
jgi:putative membrane protein (TIGR04086 family)